jgi:hypothetical protein
MSIGKMLRNNPIRRKYLQSKQAKYLDEVGAGEQNRLMLFLVPGRDGVNGGILSLISLAEESAKLKAQHGASVFVCTVPGDPPLLRYTKFTNTTQIVDLELLFRSVRKDAQVLVHIPEIFVQRFARSIRSLTCTFPGFSWQFNILLQNIDNIPENSLVRELSEFGVTTCTTAHKAYANEKTEELLGCPVYHFSVWISPEKYQRKSFAEKENLVVISPDKHPLRKEVLAALAEQMPDYRFQVIKNMTYEEYKKVISEAKFSLTFGEGLDGYLVEPVFSGAIGAAVYNDRFFTDDMRTLPFIYRSMEELQARLASDALAVDKAELFWRTHLSQFEKLAAYYSQESYLANLIRFYQEQFPAPAD